MHRVECLARVEEDQVMGDYIILAVIWDATKQTQARISKGDHQEPSAWDTFIAEISSPKSQCGS